MKAYLAQIDSSLKISDIICQHSNREELTGDDTKNAESEMQ